MSISAPRGNGPAPASGTSGGTAPEQQLTDFLGWFSLALGVPQTTEPSRVNRLIGVEDDRESRFWQRLVGARELAAAAGIFGQRRPVAWLWARVAGDAMDLTLLGNAFRKKSSDTPRLAAATASVVGVTAADVFTAVRGTREPERIERDADVDVRASITVARPIDEVYGFWRDFQNLPRFMAHLESVEPGERGRSHWKAKAPAGRTVEWDAEVTQDRPNEVIAWRSLEGAKIENYGAVRFAPAPGDRGTEIHLHLEYAAPGGKLGMGIAKLVSQAQVKDDLRRLKQVLEAGEVVRSDGSPDGAQVGRMLKQRPARPPAKPVAAEGRTS